MWYELDVKLAKNAPCGYIKDYVMLATNDPQIGHIPVAVEGQVLSEVNANPESIFLGVMQPGEKTTRQVVVQSKKPFHVFKVTGDRDSFTFPAVPEAPAKRVQILPVRLSPGPSGARWCGRSTSRRTSTGRPRKCPPTPSSTSDKSGGTGVSPVFGGSTGETPVPPIAGGCRRRIPLAEISSTCTLRPRTSGADGPHRVQ